MKDVRMKCERLHGLAGRPYPNVQAYLRINGTIVYDALLPYITRGGKKTSKSLGRFTSPEAARNAVLIGQAERLEAKAARYRREADHVLLGAVTGKRGRRIA